MFARRPPAEYYDGRPTPGQNKAVAHADGVRWYEHHTHPGRLLPSWHTAPLPDSHDAACLHGERLDADCTPCTEDIAHLAAA